MVLLGRSIRAWGQDLKPIGVTFEQDPQALTKISCGDIDISEIPKDFLLFKELPSLTSLSFGDINQWANEHNPAVKVVSSEVSQRLQKLQAEIVVRKKSTEY